MRPLVAPEIKRLTATVDDVADDGTFTGHAAIFGAEDLAHDVVERGAFDATLARRGASGVKMLFTTTRPNRSAAGWRSARMPAACSSAAASPPRSPAAARRSP